MSIDLEKELAKIKGNSAQVKLAKAGIAWSQAYRELYGVVQPETTSSKKATSENPLAKIIQEYKTQPHTPELVASFMQNFIRVKIEESGAEISIPTISVCDRTPVELAALKAAGRGMVYNPGLKYSELGRIFPKMQSYSAREDSSVTDEYERVGWVDIEMTVDAPNINTTEQDLIDLFGTQEKNGQRLSTYIWGSQISKELTDKYFDQGSTYARLLGSRRGGRVVHAYFYSRGLLRVYWDLKSDSHDPHLGGRSEGVKRA